MEIKKFTEKQIRELEDSVTLLQSEVDCYGRGGDKDELRRAKLLLKSTKETHRDLFDKTYKIFFRYMVSDGIALPPISVTRDQAYKLHEYVKNLVDKPSRS